MPHKRTIVVGLIYIFGRDEKTEGIGVPDNNRLDALGTQDKGIKLGLTALRAPPHHHDIMTLLHFHVAQDSHHR